MAGPLRLPSGTHSAHNRIQRIRVFGTLKCDFFEGRDWTGVGFEEFAAALDRYIEWYRGGKLKKALGWRTIRQAREELAGA